MGVDLREQLGQETLAVITRAWERYGVLVFREQQLTPDEQRRFSERFGKLQVMRIGNSRGKDYTFIGNANIDGLAGDLPEGSLQFHQDGCYSPAPGLYTFLYAIEVPKVGGNTLFCSTARAYRALPAELRERLLECRIIHVHDHEGMLEEDRGDHAQRHTHPVVISHPSSGEPQLFCNRLMAAAIEGLPPAESSALISQICDELERPEEIYSHAWRVGDVVAWDNLLVQHGRTDYAPTERRWMRRTHVVGAPLIPHRATLGRELAGNRVS
jgi:alpha-ketoglutarate-dependent taurine dioxygenase